MIDYSTRRPADNGIGWNCERLTPAGAGWVAVNRAPFPSRTMADAYRACFDPDDGETRVYEALAPRKKAAEPWPLAA